MWWEGFPYALPFIILTAGWVVMDHNYRIDHTDTKEDDEWWSKH